MTALEDRLAGALRDIEKHHVQQNAWKGRDEARSHTLKVVREALAAYEASKSAPAVREVSQVDATVSWHAYYDATGKDDDKISMPGIIAALNAFRDRLNGESQ